MKLSIQFLVVLLQLKLLNVITLGQMETDKTNWMITIISCFLQKCIVNGTHENWLQKAADNSKCDHIKQLTFEKLLPIVKYSFSLLKIL
jgi:hypothetical protein